MICQDILKEAEKLVAGDRQEDYGDKLTNHKNIAKLWSAYLDKEITSHDVAICMGLVKIATNLAQSISKRIPKEYKPRDEEGVRKVLNIRPFQSLLHDGEWLILCRTHEIVKNVCET